jgi:hypothetical protein
VTTPVDAALEAAAGAEATVPPDEEER